MTREGTERPEFAYPKQERDIKSLSFGELTQHAKEVQELGKTTFKETEIGYHNIYNEGIAITKISGKWVAVPNGQKFHDVLLQMFGESENQKILQERSEDREKMMQAARKVIEEMGSRIIE